MEGWRAGAFGPLICTGRGEARWAQRRLQAAGVPEAMIVLERASTTTWQNVVAVAQLQELALIPAGALWLVSDPWHLPRAALMARRLGLDTQPAPTRPELAPLTLSRQLAREGAALLKAAALHLRP